MYFVVWASRPIPSVCMDLMYVAARHIHASREVDRVDLQHELYEGSVSYTGENGWVGLVAGPVFEGVMEVEGMPTIRVRFVCRRSSLAEVRALGVERAVTIPGLPGPVRFLEYVAGDPSAVN